MNCQFLCLSNFLVLCWTAGCIWAQQMSTSSDDGNLGSSYFFYQRPEYPRDCDEIRDRCSSDISSGVYLIKPDGYPEPFEVYCDLADSKVWTVIQRRSDGSVDFNREWNDYKFGFGFLSHEVWIGHEKLSYLTNQRRYELLINVTNSQGVSCSISYDVFRISDEFGDYTLTGLGEYSGNTENCFTTCPRNMEPGNCSCQKTCQDPYDCHDTCTADATCVCSEGFYLKGEDCVPAEECGCYVSENGTIITEGGFYVNADCTRRGDCTNGQLNWNENYMCSNDAVCENRNEGRQCYCKQGYSGNGVICGIYTDCKEIYDAGNQDSGNYTIAPTGWPGDPFQVYCNMTDGGGWTSFQRRVDGSVDFYRNWASYKEGFGPVDHEFWLGNDKIYYLTNQKNYTIRIDLVNRYGAPYYAKFDLFRINNEADLYRLSELGAYTGTADQLEDLANKVKMGMCKQYDHGSHSNGLGYALSYHKTYPFSTYDRDNDANSSNCAEYRHNAWWYNSCNWSNLNGDYNATSYYPSINWYYLPEYHFYIKFTEMKIRPV